MRSPNLFTRSERRIYRNYSTENRFRRRFGRKGKRVSVKRGKGRKREEKFTPSTDSILWFDSLTRSIRLVDREDVIEDIAAKSRSRRAVERLLEAFVSNRGDTKMAR